MERHRNVSLQREMMRVMTIEELHGGYGPLPRYAVEASVELARRDAYPWRVFTVAMLAVNLCLSFCLIISVIVP